MFFGASKLLLWLLQPETWLLLLLLVTLVAIARGRRKLAQGCVASAVVLIVAVFYSPLGAALLRPLEQHVAVPQRLPDAVHGIIVLGGVISPTLTAVHGRPQLNEDGERLTELIPLARRYPEARLIYSGGSGLLFGESSTEADAARLFLSDQGVVPSRLILEDRSRNTHENALYSRELARPQPGENWVLITSAFHMRRAYGIFRKAGWEVIPYPVSFRVQPTFSFRERGYSFFALAVHEWVGIAAYSLSGKM